ncbi:MAG: hypothetical protein A2285_05645 [Elusimicrobia bacterium RIFOXYA12_FULL_57_11]|nr:MAG: hypothetical protein A2285_05645 [Elusimicrobia bacterium RIFOXYA12_FULL_57_11]
MLPTHEGNGGSSGQLRQVLEACAAVFDGPWRHRVLLLVALRSIIQDTSLVRVPLYLVAEDSVDIVALRSLLLGLFSVEGVRVQTLSQNTLAQDFARQPTLILDLSSAKESLFWQVRHLAYHRSLPDNMLQVGAIYGDTVILIPEDFAELVGPSGIVLDLERAGASLPVLPDVVAKVAAWGRNQRLYTAASISPWNLNPNDLNTTRLFPMAVKRGYLTLSSIARWMESICALDGCLTAVQECWKSGEARIAGRQPKGFVYSLIAFYLLEYLKNPENREHCALGYRLDVLAEYLKGADPLYFPNYNATELGKALMRMGTGTPNRHVFPGGKGRVLRIWRSCVKFSEVDKSKMEEICHEL